MLGTPAPSRRFLRADGDERLVARLRNGDAAAFEAIYDRYAAGLVSFSRHMLGSREEAEDAVQHTFLAAHRALLADDRDIQLKAWLYAIARNRCLSILRARREELALDDVVGVVPSTAGLASEVEQRADLRDLVADVARLPDDQRAALVLAEVGAHSHDDIAEVLDVKREKVKALVFQARESLAAARTARDTPCSEIRLELATASGAALRRGYLRRHLDVCEGCRFFRDEARRQRAALAIVLPVVPSLALRHGVLAATGSGAAVSAGGAGAGAGLGTGASLGAKTVATKVLVAAVVAGTVGGGGYAVVHALRGETTSGSDADAQAAVVDPHATSSIPALASHTADATPLRRSPARAAADALLARAAVGRTRRRASATARRRSPGVSSTARGRLVVLGTSHSGARPVRHASGVRRPTRRTASHRRPGRHSHAPAPIRHTAGAPASSPTQRAVHRAPTVSTPPAAPPPSPAPSVSTPTPPARTYVPTGDPVDRGGTGRRGDGYGREHGDRPPGLTKPFPGNGYHYGRDRRAGSGD